MGKNAKRGCFSSRSKTLLARIEKRLDAIKNGPMMSLRSQLWDEGNPAAAMRVDEARQSLSWALHRLPRANHDSGTSVPLSL